MFVKLRDKKERDRTRTFLIEGFRELSRSIQGNVPLISLFYSPDHFLGTNERNLIEQIAQTGAHIFELKKEVFDKISYRDRPDGLLALAKQTSRTLKDLESLLAQTFPSLFLEPGEMLLPSKHNALPAGSFARGS